MKKVLFPLIALVLVLGLALPMAMPAGANPGPGLVGLWHLDGNANDSSGYGNHGTVYGGAGYVAGMFDNAMYFDGTDDYVDCGNVLDVTNKLTVEAWVKDSGASGGNVVGKYEANDKRWHIYVNSGYDGKIYWNIGGSNWGTSPTSAIGTAWHHLAMVYDGTQTGNSNRLKAYIDGVPITLTFTGTIPATMPAISANVNIGRHSTSNFFQGTIDEVRIWDEALSAEQVFQSYIAPVVTTEITSGESTVSVGAEESWNITINIYGGPVDVENVVVQDGMGADLDDIQLVSCTKGGVVIAEKSVGKGKHKMRATMVTWDVGNLGAGDNETLVVTVTTGYNPLRNHKFQPKHEFTSADPAHELDGGASATYWYGDPLLEYETLETISLVVEVIDPPVLYLWPKNLSDWSFIYDTTCGVMDYNFQGPTFDFYFEGYNLTEDTAYSLIYYANPWPGDHPGALLGNGTTDSNGDITITGSRDFGHNLPTDPDANTDGAKIWLVLSDDYDDTGMKMIGWDPTEYLFEHNLINYYDTKI
jgi:hypothetical protein